MADKNKVIALSPVGPEKYETIDLDRLVIYAACELDRLGVELSLEHIIVGAFRLFPNRFSIPGYPEFPDATRVEKSLWRCKGKKRQWIAGKTPHGYAITDKTKSISEETRVQLSTSPYKTDQRTPTRLRRKEGILKETTDSLAYSKFISGKRDSISEADFCYLLQGTLDSPRDILKQNFGTLKKFADDLERGDLSTFLTWLDERFKKFLNNT
jgi:hypothetical protein